MSFTRITVTIPDGRAFVDDKAGDIYALTQDFLIGVADAAALPGYPTAVGMGWKPMATEFGPSPDTFVRKGKLLLFRPEQIGPNHWDYTFHVPCECDVEVFTSYAVGC